MNEIYLFGFSSILDEDGEDCNFFYIINEEFWKKNKTFKKYKEKQEIINFIHDMLNLYCESDGIYSECSESFNLHNSIEINLLIEKFNSLGFVFSQEIVDYAKKDIVNNLI